MANLNKLRLFIFKIIFMKEKVQILMIIVFFM
jgi:hypothetical protein